MINGKRVVATIQTRMASSRLPGKALLPLAGRPVLAHMLDRHRRSTYTDDIVIATTTDPADDAIEQWARTAEVKCYRGSVKDVLGRIVGAAESMGADVVVQGMADSPLVDPTMLDQAVELLVSGDYDCVTNEFEEDGFPVGFDVRAYTMGALQHAEETDTEEMYREHAGYSIRSRPNRGRVAHWAAEGVLKQPALRLTLDTPEDYEVIRAVYDELYPGNPTFSSEAVIKFLLSNPAVAARNASIAQHAPLHP
jgi:spore coat polysaccharide biosynthesis protein SpsF